ncbi:hypothetical protein GCM10022295_23460 [Streptomyces osmaniensis]|uniref:Uncharacterized protein n=1 Tax=Streptomyces osmaniensis TaxID=593134 RepID=A0ABP6VVX6_9ACTN
MLRERIGLGALAHVSLYKEPEFQGGSPSPVPKFSDTPSVLNDCGTTRMEGQYLMVSQITLTPASHPPSITNGCPVM